jgi:hypothetical protein
VSDIVKDLLVPGGGMATVLALGWAFIKERIKRSDTQIDTANARADTAESRAAAAETRARRFEGMWRREVQTGVRAHLAPAPRRVPDSLPPPEWAETTDVRDLREEIVANELARAREEAEDHSVPAFQAPQFPVLPAPRAPTRQQEPMRPRQQSRPAVELDVRDPRRKPDRR